MARGAFWTIIVDDQPTAFRAPVREDLLPTLKPSFIPLDMSRDVFSWMPV